MSHGGSITRQLHELALVEILSSASSLSYRSLPTAALLGGMSAACAFAKMLPRLLDLRTLFRAAASTAILHNALLVGFPNTLSVGEGSFIAQCFVGLKILFGLCSWSVLDRVGYCLCLSTMIALLASWVLFSAFRQSRHLIIAIALQLGCCTCAFRFGGISRQELVDCLGQLFASPGAKTVLGIWASGLLILVSLLFVLKDQDPSKEEGDNVSLQAIRKSFHLLAFFLFFPAGLYNIQLLRFGMIVATCLFFWCEFVRRIFVASPLSRIINEYFTKFETTEELSSSIMVSHTFLLLGCALPVWISHSSNDFHAYAGIISLCVTDTAAAIFGSLMGSHKWPNSQKSVEGTLAAILATYVFLSFIFNAVLFEQPVPDLPSILGYSLLLGMWEALSSQNDNLTMPVIAYALSKAFF